MERKFTWAWIAVATFIFDQMSKQWITGYLPKGVRHEFFYGFYITNHLNKGAGFGILQNQTLFLILVSFLALILVMWNLPSMPYKVANMAGLLTGGIIGNLVDRIALGGVRDFILLSVTANGHVFSWPTFNIADTAIVVSIVLLILQSQRSTS